VAEPPAPVVLLHGFASTFDHGWRQSGWVDILGDFDCEVPELDLPGHGARPRPTDPEAYRQVEEQVAAQLPVPCRAVGFSAGAVVLLRVAVDHPDRFERLVLLGVGDTLFEAGDGHTTLAEALVADDEPEDIEARLFHRLARTTGNDPAALAAFLTRPRTPFHPEELVAVTCPVLVVLGERDSVPAADRLVAALPDATLVRPAGVDHVGTPSDFGVIDATLTFLGLT
jgi:pimeloyl-ACP methyl ester carboxylesterase